MATIPRSQNHLAELLGISKGQASRHAARGMPTDSLEAAQAWRKATLNPAQIKGTRLDAHYRPTNPRPRVKPTEHLERATALMDLAASELESGRSIDDLVPLLRARMAAVPVDQRDLLGLHVPVMNVLVAHVMAVMPPNEPNADGTPWSPAQMSDDEAQEVGEFLYAVAAGEWRLRAPA